jgi:hypothetical protein
MVEPYHVPLTQERDRLPRLRPVRTRPPLCGSPTACMVVITTAMLSYAGGPVKSCNERSRGRCSTPPLDDAD